MRVHEGERNMSAFTTGAIRAEFEDTYNIVRKAGAECQLLLAQRKVVQGRDRAGIEYACGKGPRSRRNGKLC